MAVGTVLGRNGVIKGKHLDAWVEIRVADGSWRVLPTRAFMGHRAPKRDSAPLRRGQAAPRAASRGPAAAARARGPEEPEAEDRQDEATDEPLPRWPLFLLVPLALVVDPAAQGRPAPPAAGRVPDLAAYLGGWDELLDTAHDLGVAVPRSTRPAQAGALGVPRTLARDADVATFSPDEPDTAEEFWALVDEGRAGLRSSARPVRRVLAPLDPRSLLRRRR